MKKTILFICISVICWTGALAQETTPPKFNGADVEYFMRRLAGEFRKIAVAQEVPAGELSSRVALAFEVDTAGHAGGLRFRDNTSEGRDRSDLDPATEATRRVLTEAFSKLDGWSPALDASGRKTDYTLRLTLRLPIEKIAREQDAEPLLFMGQAPEKAFFEWVYMRVRYDQRYTKIGGVVHVRFYVEPDGKITIDEVLKTPDEKLSKEVIRVIRNSKGKWTPRKVRGVPQRTAYVFRGNFIPDAS